MGRTGRGRDPGVDRGDGGMAPGSPVAVLLRLIPRGDEGEVEEVAQHGGSLRKPIPGYPPGLRGTPQPPVELCGIWLWSDQPAHTPTARTPAPPGTPIRNPPLEKPRGPSGTSRPQEGPSGGVRTIERVRPQRESLATEADSQVPAPSSGGGTSDPCSTSEVPP